ncbi:hypothetical protein E1B28_004464 [Marasmius oreades]|uniref:RHD domain-containing protein n=1 Tax=Marasmius oreades TaxID=181124 RepID=A0A9P8AD31_9AGAR|nr:uncharacterized protein E1B28_004464 [Marasmius oreades]KAG7097078.1 hypothetical protein E1B28_004464 [Marasmius oreades]
MKGSSLFSPRTWRKKSLQRTTSETVSSSVHDHYNNSKLSSDSIWAVPDTYYVSHARSAINLRSSELSEDDDTPRPSLCLAKSSSKSAILILDDSASSGLPRQSPRRPQRPPSLNLERPEPIPQSHTQPKTSPIEPVAERRRASSSNRPLPHLTTPLLPPSLNLEKSQPTSRSHTPLKTLVINLPVAEKSVPSLSRHHSHLDTPNHLFTTRLRPQGCVPELDGVWKGFLEELEEDLHTLSGNSTNIRSPSTSRPRSRSNTTPCPSRTKRFQDLPPSPHFDKRKFDIPQNTSLTHADYSSDGEGSEASSSTADLLISLSLFPTPPPLRIRKKEVIRSLELRIRPGERPCPSSPGQSSSDSTPVTTPTTFPPLSLKSTSPKRSKFQEPSRPSHTPHTISAPERPVANRSSPSASLIQTKLRPSRSFHHPPLKHLRPFPTLHRTTSSELVSSSRAPQNQLKEGIWRSFPISHSSPSYLQSRGRKPTPSVYTPVQWGIAV